LWLAPLPAALRRRTLSRFSIRGENADRIIAFPATRAQILGELARVRGRGAIDALLAPLPEDTLQALYASCEAPERKRLVRWAAEDRPRRSPVSGSDLVGLGLAGPDVGRVLARLRAAHLDGEVANREEALALATELARQDRPPRRSGRASAKQRRATKPKKRAAKRETGKGQSKRETGKGARTKPAARKSAAQARGRAGERGPTEPRRG
jgi:hypothetical protein